MAWAQLAFSAVQLGVGAQEKKDARKDAAAALAKRRAYQTPQETLKILNATENRAQSGFDPVTLQYLTNESDRSFDAALSTSEKLGGDPNDLSALFNDKINSMMKIGAENHAQNLQNFNAYLSAQSALGQSKDAEFFSQQNLVKDAQQAAAYDKQVATSQINEGLNTGISAIAGIAEGQMYKDNNSKLDTALFTREYGKQGKNVSKFAKKNGLSYDEYNQSFSNF